MIRENIREEKRKKEKKKERKKERKKDRQKERKKEEEVSCNQAGCRHLASGLEDSPQPSKYSTLSPFLPFQPRTEFNKYRYHKRIIKQQ